MTVFGKAAKLTDGMESYALKWTPLIQAPELQTPLYCGHMPLAPNTLLHFDTVHLQPLKSKHLNNQDSFPGPKVSGIEGSHCRFNYVMMLL